MENKVTLYFKDDIFAIAGYEFGQQIYNQQAKGKLDLSKEFQIEMPPNIRYVASSFVQGFFANIIEEIGSALTKERTRIVSANVGLAEKIISKLM